jgi:hypothetical protein
LSTPTRPFYTHRNPQALTPGEVVRLDVEILPFSNVFKKGHRIRVDRDVDAEALRRVLDALGVRRSLLPLAAHSARLSACSLSLGTMGIGHPRRHDLEDHDLRCRSLQSKGLRRLADAYDRLLAARVALHLVTAERGETGKREQLRLDLQEAVAARCGYVDGDTHELAPHRLLTDLYLAARTVDHVHRRAWALIDADVTRGRRRRRRPAEREVDGFELVDGVLRVPQDRDADEPDLPAQLLATLTTTAEIVVIALMKK